jgi:hypothetical protein
MPPSSKAAKRCRLSEGYRHCNTLAAFGSTLVTQLGHWRSTFAVMHKGDIPKMSSETTLGLRLLVDHVDQLQGHCNNPVTLSRYHWLGYVNGFAPAPTFFNFKARGMSG